jgi:hypothetical protein
VEINGYVLQRSLVKVAEYASYYIKKLDIMKKFIKGLALCLVL